MNRAILLAGVFTLMAHGASGVRILLGAGDETETKWDGGVTARGATITAVEPWRFDTGDAMEPGNAWKMSTHAARRFGATGVTPAVAPQVVANGVLVLLDHETSTAEVNVRTAQGSFSSRLSDLPYGGQHRMLNGRALVERVPAWSRVTGSPDEEDFPAAAVDKAGNVWVAYLEFKHHPDHDRIRLTPNRFELMTAPPGGDQIMVKRYSNGAWSDPITISAPGGDLYRPAIAADGRGRVWVFWPANERGNFDIWARVLENGKAGPTVRISNAPGSDIDPAAAT